MDTLFEHTLLLLLTSTVAVAFAIRLGAPSILGYLIAGVALGPSGFGLIQATEGTRFLAELGIVLLMFMVGLEFSLPTVWRARRMVAGAGFMQVTLTAGLIGAGIIYFGIPADSAVLLAAAIAMSSTAITLKLLSEQGELTTRHGRLATGILLFQDLATLPFLVLISAWSQGMQADPIGVVRKVVVALAAFAAAAAVSRPLFRGLLARIARAGAGELFLLAALLLVFGTAFGTHALGLSAPIGAFLAGMVVGESDFRHRIEDDVRPFRDVLLGLFFITVGMQVDPRILFDSPAAAAGWLGVFLLVKAALVVPVARLVGLSPVDALRGGIILAHGGEFGLLLLSLGLSHGFIDAAMGQPTLVALIASMMLAPLVIQKHDRIATLLVGPLAREKSQEEESTLAERSQGLREHVIVCGGGRIGRVIARALDAAHLPCLVIEADFGRHSEARQLGIRSVFGDASRRRSLEAAGLAQARLLITTFSNIRALERLVHFVQDKHPGVRLLSSAHDEHDAARLSRLGIESVFPENIAAGLALSELALRFAGLSPEKAASIVADLRRVEDGCRTARRAGVHDSARES